MKTNWFKVLGIIILCSVLNPTPEDVVFHILGLPITLRNISAIIIGVGAWFLAQEQE